MTNAPIPVLGLAHIGIRVHDLERSVRFYALLGFTKTAGPIGPEPVAILDHPSGVEINLVLNAPSASAPNILMDVPPDGPAARRRGGAAACASDRIASSRYPGAEPGGGRRPDHDQRQPGCSALRRHRFLPRPHRPHIV
jgi:catechol 2,3-dioxygenase-like lactoylglutathione lyase family enzyme